MTKGFSLIEVLAIFALLSVLTVIAFPNYQQHLTRARRIEGQTALLDLACRMELYFLKQHTYQTARIGTGTSADLLDTPVSQNGFYRLSIVHASDTNFTLNATPIGAQHHYDKECNPLTLNHFGSQGPKQTCW